MAPLPPDDRLSTFSTSWSLIEQAHDSSAADAQRQAARHQLLRSYENVVRRYLHGALRRQADREAAVADCFQEFCVRLLSGRLQGAERERGPFRRYLQTVVSNLVADYHRQRTRQPESLGEHDPASADAEASEEDFVQIWREELVGRALLALADHEKRTGQVLYSVLKLKIDRPELTAEQIAEQLSRPEQARTAVWVRQRLFRAREKLCDFLVAEVRQSLREPTDERVQDELQVLGLLEQCRAVFTRPGKGAP
jgi:RNA polymerase sigma factor (sigma-70 family)